ncbi:MAG: NINE protein [Gemmatimonadales bacterium]
MTYSRGPVDRYEPADAGEEVSDRSRGATLALAIVGGVVGLHRFYVGKVGSGVLMILTLGGFGLWWLYDLIVITAGDFRDGDGRTIRRWEGAVGGVPVAPGDRRFTQLADQVDHLQREVGELAERLDFAERMLARQRDRLPPS